ncbi:DegV family protein [Caldibacillus debilis]|uniref:DegV family protein n=1 Tax=Caldibacillus debilis TaxID=301148 RepID=UPI00037C8F63|nr:DegV family protein [Caldibacillus debilis]OUM89756.1 MAG: fatty acid-binding protein DegV [Caldibacillus debilis]
MKRISITTDITSDLSQDLLEKYGIRTVPLYITLDGKSYKDTLEISPEEIFAYAERTGKLPKTAAAPIQEFIDFFRKVSAESESVIHINLGSKFSSTHQNAVIAAREFENVYVVDSANLSTGSGHVVLEAAKLAEEGLSAREIVEKLERLVPKVEASFVIDTLDYLKMGGRCSSLVAMGAALLNIKPCIEVINGEMTVGKKYRGKIERAIEKYVTDRLKDRDDIVTDRIFITHAGCPEEIIERTKDLVKELQPFDEVIVTTASCTISCHCGPKTLGVLFKRK